MKRILFVFPTAWDRRQLASCREAWEGRYEIEFAEPSHEEVGYDFDILGFIEEIARRRDLDGVLSSSDYPGATTAAAIASALGLPGARPETVLGCSHKYYSRLTQRKAVPEAVPRFWLVDAWSPDEGLAGIEYPAFVKPVKGAFSILSQRVDSEEELRAFLAQPAISEFTREYMRIFDQLLERFTGFDVGGRHFLVEELLRGLQVTVEGFCHAGEVEIVGIVDSVMHPGTKSFARFDHPSFIREEIQERMKDVARRVALESGLRETFFNIEMIWQPAFDSVHVIEINPRICGQFGDLYQKVDGTNSYAVALTLAAGDPVSWVPSGGRYAFASSFPLRIFEPSRVLAAPGQEERRAAEALFPGTLCWSECETGQELVDFSFEDGSSARYGIVNVGADSREELLERFEGVREQLGYRFVRHGGTEHGGD